MEHSPGDLDALLLTALSETLCVEPEDIRSDSHLIDDLGMKSIDVLDIYFRLERETGRKFGRSSIYVALSAGDLRNHFELAQGQESATTWSTTPMTFARLKEWMGMVMSEGEKR